MYEKQCGHSCPTKRSPLQGTYNCRFNIEDQAVLKLSSITAVQVLLGALRCVALWLLLNAFFMGTVGCIASVKPSISFTSMSAPTCKKSAEKALRVLPPARLNLNVMIPQGIRSPLRIHEQESGTLGVWWALCAYQHTTTLL